MDYYLSRRAHILGPDPANPGKALVGLDRQTATGQESVYSVSVPLAYSGPSGEIIGGFPARNTPVMLQRAQGEWIIESIIKSDNTFPNTNEFGFDSVEGNLMGELTIGRILLQTAGAANRLYLHPTQGINIGNQTSALHIDTQRDTITHDFSREMGFTEGHRKVVGRIKRDVEANSLRGISYSMLSSSEYDDSLKDIAMNPSRWVSFAHSEDEIRNLPLVESRETIYEFSNISNVVDFRTDQEEAQLYETKENIKPPKELLKTDTRAYAFGLSLFAPNHLMETVRGTGVDALGNVIDLNRNVLPIGREDDLSFGLSNDNKEVFRKTRALHRRALAYHFEINARKAASADDEIFEVPSIDSKDDYARNRSRFFVDIDKEGQFKINVPASSETGNVPLLARYENASAMLAAQGDSENPNAFVIENKNNIDVYLDSHATYQPIALRNVTTGEPVGPQDRITESLIQYGTAYHDVSKSGYQFTKKRLEDDVVGLLVRYMERDGVTPSSAKFDLNQRQNSIQYDKIVEPFLFVEGESVADSEAQPSSAPDANPLDGRQHPNAGGRSGTINLDGFVSVNIGANTSDRQSMWLDCAGGIVSNIGRDRRGVSYCASLDGDLLIQVGGTSPAGDSRFTGDNVAYRAGAVDIRVLNKAGMTVFRIDEKGMTVSVMGRCEIASQQTMTFKSKTKILFEAPYIAFFPDGSDENNPGVRRQVKRSGTDI
jgi:hypothetical protein